MAPASTAPHYRPLAPPAPHGVNGHGVFTSPTESEFSESYKEAKESILDWDESRVGDWLKSINCAQYVEIFRKNNITGENLMDLDQATLKEMGIKKIGDRVRINTHAKVFRSNVYKRTSKRVMNRVGTLNNLDMLFLANDFTALACHPRWQPTANTAIIRITQALTFS